MLRVGLTGGIAAGKSLVGSIFAELGVHVIRADDIAHGLMVPGKKVYDEVVGRFGSGILKADNTIDRGKLAEAAFGLSSASKSRIEELNQIVHPAVIEKQEEWMDEIARRDANGIAMVEAALILEADLMKYFDKLVVVTCRHEQRIARWAARTNVSIEAAQQEVERRLASQWPDEVKIKAADFVIDNSGSGAETEERVRDVFARLRNNLK